MPEHFSGQIQQFIIEPPQTANPEAEAREIIHNNPEWQQALNQLLEEERLEHLSGFEDSPEMMTEVQGFIRLNDREPAIYIDPRISEENRAAIQRLDEILRSEDYQSATNRINQMLPDFYGQFDDKIGLPIFIFANDSQFNSGELGGVSGKKPKFIKLAERSLTQDSSRRPEEIITHERVHTIEPDNAGTFFKVFNEGMADLNGCYETTDIHHYLLSVFTIVKGKSDHLLNEMINSDGIKIDLVKLLSDKANTKIENAPLEYNQTSIVTKYLAIASFLSWYHDNIDPKLSFLDPEQENYHYTTTLNRILIKAYPPQAMPNPDYQPPSREITKTIDPTTPPVRRRPGQISRPEIFVSTVPIELSVLDTTAGQMVFNMDPNAKRQLAETETAKPETLRKKLFEYANYIQERINFMSKEYSKTLAEAQIKLFEETKS